MDKEQLGETFAAKQAEWAQELGAREREKEALERKEKLYTEIKQKVFELFPMTEDDEKRLGNIDNHTKTTKTDGGDGVRFRFSRQSQTVPMPQIDNIPLGAIQAEVSFDEYFKADAHLKRTSLLSGPEYSLTNIRGTGVLDYLRITFTAQKPTGETGQVAGCKCDFRPDNDNLSELEEVASSLYLIEDAMALQASQ